MNTVAEHAPLAALLFFFVIFVWIGVRTYRPSARRALQAHAFIPLEEDRHD